MSMSKVSMALDDVIKADRKANKGKGKNAGAGAKKNAGKGAAQSPATAKLVKKLVKKALAQRGVGTKPRNVRANNSGNRTIVKKIVRKVSAPAKGNRNKSLGVSQRSRTIVRRRVVPAPQPTRTIVREVRYVQEPPRPAPRIQRRVVYQQPRPAPRREVVYVNAPPRRQERYGGSSFSSRRSAPRRNNDPFYEPRNFLQRLPPVRY